MFKKFIFEHDNHDGNNIYLLWLRKYYLFEHNDYHGNNV